MDWNWHELWTWLPLILRGFQLALVLCFIGIALTMVFAVPLALMRMSRIRALSLLANGFIAITRAIPLYIFLLWVYFGLPLFLEIDLSPVTAGIVTLVVQFSAFQAEAYRSGLLVVGKGQREAALAVGLSGLQTFLFVVLPQAMKVAVPPTVNNLISMFKATSVFAVIGVVEATRLVQSIINTTGRPLEYLTVLAVVYIVCVGVMSTTVGFYERSMRLPSERTRTRPTWQRLVRQSKQLPQKV